jgi:hypothetical protein
MGDTPNVDMAGDKNAYIPGGQPDDNRPHRRSCGRPRHMWRTKNKVVLRVTNVKGQVSNKSTNTAVVYSS